MSDVVTALIPTSVKLEPRLKARLKKLGKQKRRTVHWLMKDAIRRYIAVEEEAIYLRNETLERWNEAEQGQTIHHGTISDWLDSWGNKKEKSQPKCNKKRDN